MASCLFANAPYLIRPLLIARLGGLVTCACFAEMGHEVICVDNDERKVKALHYGRIPIYEPGLEQLVLRNVSACRLHFTGSIEYGVDTSQVIFIAVPTPPRADGSVDLTYIERVAREIASVLKDYRVIVDKSTIPLKTAEKVADTIRRYNKVNAQGVPRVAIPIGYDHRAWLRESPIKKPVWSLH